MCDHFGPNPRTRVKFRSLFSLLTLLSIVDVARGGRGRRWRSQRMNWVGARAARCLGRCGRHERAIYSPLFTGRICTEITRVSRSSSSRSPSFELCAVAGKGGVGEGSEIKTSAENVTVKRHSRAWCMVFRHPAVAHVRVRWYRSRLVTVAALIWDLRAGSRCVGSLGMHALRVCIIPEARCRDHGSHFLWHDQLWTKVDNQNPKEENIKKVAHKTSTGSSVVFATALQCGVEPRRLARVTK